MKRYKVTQIMNTKQLGLMLVAGLLSFGISAQVNLNPTPPATAGTAVLANENTIDAAMGTDVSGAQYNVMGEAGFIIPSGETYYGRIDLGGGAKFVTTVANNFTLPGATIGRASGGMGDGSVILSIQAGGALVAVDEGWTLQGVTYKLNSKSNVSFRYRLYETPSAAVAGGSSPLSTQMEDLIRFSNATTMAGAPSPSGPTGEINVATSSVKYVNGTSTNHVMKINVKNASDSIPLGAGPQRSATTGLDLTLEEVAASVTLTATGDFTAVGAATEDGPAGKVWLDKDANCTPNIRAPVGTEGEAGFVAGEPDYTPWDPTPDDGNTANDVNPNAGGHNLGLATINEAGIEAVVTVRNPADADFAQITNAFLCMETNGVSEIPEGTYSGVLSMTANMGFIAIPNVPFTGSTLVKNGESAVLNFLLSPNGVFRNYVRLTNTSPYAGSNLSVTLYNDSGDSITFPLSDVDGLSSDLAANASTALININALYAAAQAVDRGVDADDEPVATFTVTGGTYGNKLRARFEGSILENHLKAQALSVSTDNTTFFTF